MKELYTIGYAGYEINNFISILKKYHINSLIDVRSSPYSKIYVDYNKEYLEKTLKNNKIIYKHYGKEFGARQNNMVYYTDGYLNFSLYSKSENFQLGMKKIIQSMPLGYNFVLMCSEKDPITCHRNIMVAKEFYNHEIKIKNILSDGTTINQEEIEKRLVDLYYPNRNQLSLFDSQLSWEEMVRNSYEMQNKKIGYRFSGEKEDVGDE